MIQSVNSLVRHGFLIIAFIIIEAHLSLAEIKVALGKSFFARHYAGISLRDLDTAWSLISNFNGLPKLHPGIISSEIEGSKRINELGCIRYLKLADGDWVREELTDLNPAEFTFTYIITEGSVPFFNYRSTVKISPQPDMGTAMIAWVGEFEVPEGVDGDETAAGISSGIYKVCVDGIISNLSSRAAATNDAIGTEL